MSLAGKKVAILVEQDYQDLEVWYPALRLREEGAETLFVGTEKGGSYKGKFGYPVTADAGISEARAEEYDALVIPGGWAPDFMRREPAFARFTAEMAAAGKPVACICHGGWLLASSKAFSGRTATSFSAIRDDVENAGMKWVDEEVVVDGNLVTSRKPDDLPAFTRELIRLLESR